MLSFLFHLQYGETPFMSACQSSINRLAKVRYLEEKGAVCQAKDHVRCCLFATNSTNRRLFYSEWADGFVLCHSSLSVRG